MQHDNITTDLLSIAIIDEGFMKHFLVLICLLFASSAFAGEVPTDPWKVSPLLPGQKAPAFTAPSATGGDFTFDPSNMEKPMILIFYRGGWCPFCNLHFAELRKAEQPLLDMGYEMNFISMDTAELMAEAHLKGDEPLTYGLISDADANISKAFGVGFRVDDETYNKYKNDYKLDLEQKAGGNDHHILPAPSVFVIDTDGIVKFSYTNPDYKVRLHPDVLVSAARNMPGYAMRR